VVRLVPTLCAVLFFVACSKTAGVTPPSGGRSGADTTTRTRSTRLTADSVTGYYKVTETTIAAYPNFLWVPSKSFIFAAEIKKQNDSAIQLYQSMRSPLVYWTYDWGLSINYNQNDSLTNGSAPAWGRIINDSTVNFHYEISNCIGCSIYTVTQQWTKLQHAADTALYGFKDTVKNKVTTFAGSTFKGDPVVAASYGDGGPAVAANLSAPVCVTMDAAGNVYVAESGHNTVRKIDVNGIISVVAGTYNWEGGYSGDGGPATSALLGYPDGLAVNKEGDLFIAEYYNQVIRRVDHATGIITTFAGTGKAGYSGDNGPATLAQLSSPGGMVFDGNDNLYIADGGNNVIRKITPAGVITTIAGTGVAGYTGNEGPATQAELSGPADVRLDAQNNLYIADGWFGSIRMVDPSGIIHLFAGGNFGAAGDPNGDGGPATSASISPKSIAIDPSGIVYLAETGGTVRKITKDGLINTIAGSWVTTLYEFGNYSYCGDYGPALQAAMSPYGICMDQQGNLLVADYYNNRIRKVFYP
jgi:streptogramin lyase